MDDMDTGAVSSKEKSGKKAVKTANNDKPDPKIRKGKDDKKKLSLGKSISSDITVETVWCTKVPFLKVHDRILRLK